MTAVFDVDGTITAANCTAALVVALASEGEVSRVRVAALGVRSTLHRAGLHTFPGLMARTYRTLYGLDVSRVDACAARVVRDVVVPAMYPEAVSRIAWHRARGDRVVLASAAPRMVVGLVGRHLGVADVVATDFESVAGTIGVVKTPAAFGAGKVERVRRMGVLEDAGAFHVYTDHAEDWPLVAAARFATLVNPGSAFVRRARRCGIPHDVVRWRTHTAGRDTNRQGAACR